MENIYQPVKTEAFSYGDEVRNPTRKQTGVVMSAKETIVCVRYYDLFTGDLSQFDEETPMQDLINDSTK